jgi:hypothetical protein
VVEHGGRAVAGRCESTGHRRNAVVGQTAKCRILPGFKRPVFLLVKR